MRALIAYPGTEGSFSEAAAREAFPNADLKGFPTFPEAAQAVLSDEAEFCLLPVENSFAGGVPLTYTILLKNPLYIVQERTKQVRHQLLALPGARLENIRRVASHPQAIAQCDEFLATMSNVSIEPSANTAISAREVSESGDLTRAAIASEDAAKAWGLEILKRDIQTSDRNITRFYVVAKAGMPLGRPDKATVVFTLSNEVGSLARLLTIFAENGLNMSRIESRPIPDEPFAYLFIADFEGNMDVGQLTVAMKEASRCTRELRLIGVYPKAAGLDKTDV